MNQIMSAVLGLSTPFFFLWLQTSMVFTAMTLKADRNERRMSNAPFLTLLTNSFLWILYARLEHSMAIFVVNLIGVVVGIYCTATFHLYSVYPAEPMGYYLAGLVIIIAMICSSLDLVSIVTSLTILSTVSLYCSPLATMNQVLTDRSTRSMSFPICVSAFLTALSWSLYGGAVAKSLELLVPSIIGVVLTSAQLFLFVIYGFDDTPSYAHIPFA
jgi:solute carrier family 50 (sugar transporter)